MNSDQVNEAFNRAVNRGVAEMRNLLQDASSRFETEMKKVAEAVKSDDPDGERRRAAGEQIQGVMDTIRTEATKAAGQFSDGVNSVVEDMREFVQENVKGAEQSGGAADGDASTAASSAAGAGPAKKSTAKKSTTKKATKKATAKKATAKKSPAKKAAAKKSTTKKATKKATAKKATKKATTKKKQS